MSYLGCLSLDLTGTRQRSVNFTSEERYGHLEDVRREVGNAEFIVQRSATGVKTELSGSNIFKGS